jgi:hypothetical protein
VRLLVRLLLLPPLRLGCLFRLLLSQRCLHLGVLLSSTRGTQLAPQLRLLTVANSALCG